jgi:hypothetical protein
MRNLSDWMDDWRIEMQSLNPKLIDLVEELIPQEPTYSLIAGKTGIGKTVLSLNLAFSLATGTPFYGLKVKQTVVGYLAFEGTKGKMFERLEKVARNYPPVGDNLRFEIRKPFYPFENQQNEKELLDMVAGCQILFVDPIKYLVKGDYTKPSVANAFIMNWINLQEGGKFSTIFCIQVRKQNPNSIIEPGDLWEIKGCADYVESATSALLLERERQGHRPSGGFAPVSADDVVLHFAKHRDAIGDMPPIKLKLNRRKLWFDKT